MNVHYKLKLLEAACMIWSSHVSRMLVHLGLQPAHAWLAVNQAFALFCFFVFFPHIFPLSYKAQRKYWRYYIWFKPLEPCVICERVEGQLHVKQKIVTTVSFCLASHFGKFFLMKWVWYLYISCHFSHLQWWSSEIYVNIWGLAQCVYPSY